MQSLQLLLSSWPGDYATNPSFGSHYSRCWEKYKDDFQLLARMIKIEIIRFMEVKYGEVGKHSEFNFINCVLTLEVLAVDVDNDYSKIELQLELENFEHM